MSLKNALLALSMGATMIGGHTDARTKEMPSQEPTQSHTLSAAELRAQKFRENYNHLWETAEGANFTFGDTKKLRQYLKEIAETPMGYEIIANLTKETQLATVRGIPDPLQAFYALETKDVYMRAFLKNDVEEKICLFHELLHAYQKEKGLCLDDHQASFEQVVVAGKLIEAEAVSWNMVHAMTNVVCSDCFEKNPYILEAFKEMDMDKDLHLFGDLSQQEQKQQIDLYKQFQKYFIQSGGKTSQDLQQAQQKMVGYLMVRCMKQDMNNALMRKWRKHYDKQAIQNATVFAREGKVTKNGNQKAYNQMINYYVQRYGVKRSDIDTMGLGTEGKTAFKLAKAEVQQAGYLKNTKQSQMASRTYQNRQGR